MKKTLKYINKEDMLTKIWQEIKWLLPYIKKYRSAIIFYIFLGVLGTVMGLIGSIASKYLIDAVTGHQSNNILLIIMTILLFSFGSILIGAITNRISTKINLIVHNELRADVYEKFMNTDWQSVSEYTSGDLLNRFNKDVTEVANSILGWIPSFITTFVQFTGTFMIILYYDITMAVLALLSAPVTLVLSRLLVARMREHNQKMKQINSELMAFQEESFRMVQTIKAFDLTNIFGKRLKDIQQYYLSSALDYNKLSIYTSTFLSMIGVVVSYATFGWGVYRLWGGFITYGTMTLFLQLAGGLSGGFSALVGLVPSAIGAATSAGRIKAITELPREKEEDISRIKIMEQNTEAQGYEVKLSHIDFAYKGRDQVLKDVCIHAKPGEIVAIIGQSGEGKTTLIRLLTGLIRAEAGEAKLVDRHGLEIRISKATRKYFSYVPQGNTIFTGSVAYNLRMVQSDASDDELIAALKAACAYDFIEALPEGIYSRVGENGVGFSEGQAQRLSIARALLRDAPILLLDEATSALDAETEQRILQNIKSYGKTRTCILTTHRQSVLSICDRGYQINDNRISEFSKEQFSKLAVNLS